MSASRPLWPRPSPGVEVITAIGFLIASIACTWPLADLSPLRLPFSHDAMFSTWRLAWIAHQLPLEPLRLFDTNVFWPETNTLAYSDAMLLLGLVAAPFIHAGVHPVLVHNALVITAFAFAAVGGFRLAHALTASVPAAVVAGVIFAFAPYRFAHIGHLELLWTGFMPLSVLALYRVLVSPSPARGLWLGTLMAGQALCSLYYFVFLAMWLLILAALAPLHLAVRLRTKHVTAFALTTLLLVVFLLPYAIPYSTARTALGPRSSSEVVAYSAELVDYLRAPWGNRLYGPSWEEALEERSLFPGLIALGLSLGAVVIARSRLAAVFAVATLAAVELSRGAHGWLYPLLSTMVTMLTSLRAPARLGVVTLLGISVLAALGLAHVLNGRMRRTKVMVSVAVLLGLGVEYWSAPVAMRSVPLTPPRVYQWLERQTPLVTLELPVPSPAELWGAEPEFQFASVYHWRPLLNGYSGFAPRSYLERLQRWQPHGETALLPEPIRVWLATGGVQVVIVHERLVSSSQFNDALAACEDRRYFSEVVVFQAGAGAGRSAACRVRAADAARQ